MKVPRTHQRKAKRIPKTAASTANSQAANRVYHFGSFSLNEREQQLLRNGEPIRLPPKVFGVLLVLVQNRGCLLTKEKLLQEVWPDAFVEEANLNVNIAGLRKALGERPGEDQFIETIPKRGYRFIANVVQGEVNSNWEHRAGTNSVETNRDKQEVKIHNSLAVLPFHNGSEDPNAEYLSDGLTESIINSISHGDIRVVGRNTVIRYKGKKVDPQKIGEELGVRSVLTGRILQLGDRLIIRAEVIDVLDGWQIWGEQYHRKTSDVLALQEEIAEEISEKLILKLTVDEKRACRFASD